uniref:Uncharacterized protein n=1 Tax=Anopheles epiroticus TaxID=199890 RepID=A0A182P8B5_9DIPT
MRSAPWAELVNKVSSFWPENTPGRSTRDYFTQRRGRYLTRIWFGLVAMAVISVPQREDAASKDAGYPLAQKTLPFGARYPLDPEHPGAVHAQQLRTDTDYVDSAATSARTSKVSTTRRQYTVPQLFVSYGWGPMGSALLLLLQDLCGRRE